MFKDKLREFRENKGITQVEMAKLLNMTSTGYGAYERGECEPNLKTLKNICNILSVSADQLLEINTKQNFNNSDIRFLENLISKIKKNCNIKARYKL